MFKGSTTPFHEGARNSCDYASMRGTMPLAHLEGLYNVRMLGKSGEET